MKRILITGANSYIGESFNKYINKYYPEYFHIETIDMIGTSWKSKDFSTYDTVFHVAGIAHSDTNKVNDEVKEKYYKVNTYLAIETARKAKLEGVKQFIFMSSAIVYGDSAPIGKTKIITIDTVPSPANFYGDSKLQAEKGIVGLQDENFNVVILRPPMIYGKCSKGNYPVLSKVAKSLPIFPKVNNKRSMLYVENLCEFVRLMCINEENGVFFPQNSEYSVTSELVKMIASAHKKKIFIISGFGWALKLVSHFFGFINKAFGNMCYDFSLSEYRDNYRVCTLAESIERTERD